MMTREAALHALGIDMRPAKDQTETVVIADMNTFAAFSGYGEFTPITVRAHTVMVDADLERDQQRN